MDPRPWRGVPWMVGVLKCQEAVAVRVQKQWEEPPLPAPQNTKQSSPVIAYNSIIII